MRKHVFAAAAAAALVGAVGFMPANAIAAGYGKVTVENNGKTVVIGNDAISRTFDVSGKKLKTTLIDNKLGNAELTPGAGSEEFVIGSLKPVTMKEPSAALHSVKPSAVPAVQVSASTSEAGEGGHAANLAIDGKADTYWAAAEGEKDNPWFELNFGREVQVKKLKYTPRFDNTNKYQCTGQAYKLTVQAWENGAWKDVHEATLSKEKENVANQEIVLSKTVATTKLRLVITESYFWNSQSNPNHKHGNIAELEVLNEQGKSVLNEAATPWSVKANSNAQGDGGGAAALIDGNNGTYWHSRYGEGEGPKSLPVEVTLNRGANGNPFQTIKYRSRGVSNGAPGNGSWLEFQVYASDTEEGLFDKANLVKTANGSKTFKANYSGMNLSTAQGMKDLYFGLKEKCDKQFVGFKITKGAGGSFASGAEIDLMKESFTSVENPEGDPLCTSEMELASTKVEDVDHVINKENKHGKLVTFTFAPAKFGEANLTVVQKVAMYDGDHFMRKWLEIKSDNKSERINYIDGEHLNLTGAEKTWTIPTNAGGVVAMDVSRANLGQPFYAQGMFFGSEFPETDTQIVEDASIEKMGRTRYWTGKNFADFERDAQLDTAGEFVTWQNVCGASHTNGSDMNVLQSDFFAYITSIAKPSDFRIQYNSWFDNMMLITDDNILKSFKAVDKHLSETGVRPLDSYVVDDGWVNYNKDRVLDAPRTGTSLNKSGFWEFNTKFPQELTPSSSLVKKLGSNFGVWIGPRGGYNFYGSLADIMTAKGTGSKAGGSIDVADHTYVKNFGDMAVDWMKKWDVNYWKWDGFADGGQYGHFKQGEGVVGYSESNRHMYGGPNGFYHATDLWEQWINLFERVWKTADAEQINKLWISLTCYVNPSPWFMQWSNSVWIQCVGDRGEVHNGAMNDKMNTMLTYRDACYYDFIVKHQFQFPLANLYNHDPIYGKEGTGIKADSMNGEQFRNYLYMMGTRGTAFWELYYSDSLFDDEKYLVNADFLKWEEENFSMLRNAKWIGGKPSNVAGLSSSPTVTENGAQEAYGFSGFNVKGDEGIISMRNPDKAVKTITFTLADGMGCKVEGDYMVVVDHAYSNNGKPVAKAPATITKGDKVTVSLQPGETQVWHLSKDGDTVAPALSKVYTPENNIVRVQASEHVYGAKFEVFVNGKKVNLAEGAVKAYADLKTFDITLPEVPANGATISVKAVAGADAAGNKLAGELSRTFHVDGIIAQIGEVKCPNIAAKKHSVKGINGFAVQASMADAKAGTLVSQGDEWSLSINNEGKAVFTVNGVSAVSDVKVSGVASVAGVRENNGMLKVYVNGEIAGNKYDAKKVLGYEVKAAGIKASNKASIISCTVYDRSIGYDEVLASPLAELVKQVKALKPVVTAESWKAAGMDKALAAAEEALKGTDSAAQLKAYNDLKAAYGKLVPGQGEITVTNLAKGIAPTAGWLPGNNTPAGEAENSGSPLSRATDGAVGDVNGYGIFGKDSVLKPAYMQIDLGSEAVIQSAELWRYWGGNREYADTALVVSNDPSFEEKQVLYYSDLNGDKKDTFNLGVKPSEKTYAESDKGKKLFDNEKKPARGRYVRLYGNGYKGGEGKENHVIELKLTGYRISKPTDPFNLADFEALIARADEVLAHEKDYSIKSFAAVKKAYGPAVEAYKKAKAETESGEFTLTYDEVNGPREALRAALNCLKDPSESPMLPIEPSKPVYPMTPIEPSLPVEKPQGDNGTVKPNGEQKPAKPNKPSKGELVQTGDNSMVMIAGVAALGIAGLAAGIYLSKRTNA